MTRLLERQNDDTSEPQDGPDARGEPGQHVTVGHTVVRRVAHRVPTHHPLVEHEVELGVADVVGDHADGEQYLEVQGPVGIDVDHQRHAQEDDCCHGLVAKAFRLFLGGNLLVSDFSVHGLTSR